MNKSILTHGLLIMALVLSLGFELGQNPVVAQENESMGQMPAMKTFPEIIQLPTGFSPEGIATGKGTSFYVGSLAGGAIYKGDLKTGRGEILVQQEEGQMAVGLSVDVKNSLLFVCGGRNGDARVYDTQTGELKAEYTLSTAENKFINDVITTKKGAYLTNSAQGVLYHIPVKSGGKLPDESAVTEISLGREYEMVEGFNANGIEATPNGKTLIVVNSSTGKLYSVDPKSGAAKEIDLGDANVKNGDGILLDGHTLYVVQNQMNKIATVKLGVDYSSGEVIDTITHEAFAVPTTVAMHRKYLYAVNAKFGTNPEGKAYEVVKVEK
ncbi:MAG: superoxide dismutase [Candidatus Marinimicrobia bacterium]|nr:superoxide dismutase [Candidatus Neomarinimicrobiota bacterium]MCF7829392.1 superoxide dismutase [Candidatus Neomarinimicrobiota bacterium]MCF7880878.1 superoxide dismutase [Candidatus Neomarinimicrobiota bacterium]